MKASELRVNSYHYFNGQVVKLDLDSIHGVATYDLLDQYQAIPLTEEWLVRFGFDYLDLRFWSSKLCIHLKDNEFYVLYEQGRLFIQYVHQLQNLYFALTGEELEIK